MPLSHIKPIKRSKELGKGRAGEKRELRIKGGKSFLIPLASRSLNKRELKIV
jgi:hypothetical protein